MAIGQLKEGEVETVPVPKTKRDSLDLGVKPSKKEEKSKNK